MSKAVSGYPYYTSTAWKRLLQSIPSTYTIWFDGTSYRAESNKVGAIDLPATTFGELINTISTGLDNCVVHVRAGDYPIAESITSLNGLDNVNLTLENGARLYRTGGVGYHLLDIQNCTHVTIAGGIIDGVSNDATEGLDEYKSNSVHLEDCNDVTFHNVLFDNASDDAVWIQESNKIKVQNCAVSDFYKHGISVYSEAGATCQDIVISGNNVDAENGQVYDGITVYAYNPNGVTITGNTVRNVYNVGVGSDQSGIHVEDPGVAADYSVTSVSANTIIGCKFGITTASARPVAITGNAIYNCASRGIFLFNPLYTTIVGNTIQTCPTGIYSYGGANCTISNNAINDSTSYGIDLVVNLSGLSLCRSNVNGNIIKGVTGEDGIRAAFSHELNLNDNNLYTIAKHGINCLIIQKSNVCRNMILDAGQATGNTYDGIYIGGDAVNYSYWNNILHNYVSNDAGTVKYCLHLNAFASTHTIAHNMLNLAGGGTLALIDMNGNNIIRENRGYNPIGQIATPFIASTDVITVAGSAATPEASTDYTILSGDIYITSSDSGNANCAIVVKDTDGIQVYPRTGSVSTLNGVFVPVGFKINWGAYTGAAPTVVVSFT